jgi:pyruvate formate lyase activating enzyme
MARKQVGEKYSLEVLLGLLLRDRVFYHNSKGGVTLSGGEAMLQHEFVYDLLCRLSERDIHTAIETCGHVEEKIFKRLTKCVDLLLFDIKHTDPNKHRRFTGISNNLIMNNFMWAVETGKEIIVRFPLIPGVNDDAETLSSVVDICLSADLRVIHVLPFHQAGQPKWLGLEREYSLEGLDSLDGDAVEEVKCFFETRGISANIGGYC